MDPTMSEAVETVPPVGYPLTGRPLMLGRCPERYDRAGNVHHGKRCQLTAGHTGHQHRWDSPLRAGWVYWR